MYPWLVICFIAQIAIFIKKIHLKKEIERRSAKGCKPSNFMNTQQWNQFVMTTSQLLLLVFIISFSQRSVVVLVQLLNLNSYEKSFLSTNFQQVLLLLHRSLNQQLMRVKKSCLVMTHQWFKVMFVVLEILCNL